MFESRSGHRLPQQTFRGFQALLCRSLDYRIRPVPLPFHFRSCSLLSAAQSFDAVCPELLTPDRNCKVPLWLHFLQFFLRHLYLSRKRLRSLADNRTCRALVCLRCYRVVTTRPMRSACYHCRVLLLLSACVKKFQVKRLIVFGHKAFLSPSFRRNRWMLIAFLSCFSTYSRRSVSPLFNLHLETSE